MRQQLAKKLRARSGETLAEVLIALLIIVLAVALMVVMINTAASIDISARERDKNFYADLTAAETYTDTAIPGSSITIEIQGDTTTSKSFPVDVYGDGKLNSYKKSAGGDP